MQYLGDFVEDATINLYFTTHDTSGGAVAPSSAFESADVAIYKGSSATQKTATDGLTMTSPFDSVTGLHLLVIDTSDDTNDAGFWEAGNDYTVVLNPDETVDSQTVVKAWQFSLENRFGVAALSDIDSLLASQFTVVEDFVSDIYSDTTLLVTNVAVIDQDTSDLKSALDSQFTIVEDFVSDTYSHLVVTDAVVDTIYSDTTILVPAVSDVKSELVIISDQVSLIVSNQASQFTILEDFASDTYSHLVVTDAVVDTIYSDTTVIESDTTVIEAAGGALTAAQASQLAQVRSDVISQYVVIEDYLSDIYSDTVIITSDLAEVDTSDIQSLLTKVYSDTTVVESDTTAIETETAKLDSAHSEPTGVPAANETPLDKLGYVFMALRNQLDVTASKKQFYDDDGNVEWEKDLSDDGTTYSETEGNAP